MSKFREFIILHCVLPLAEKVVGTCSYKWLNQLTKMQSWSSEKIVKWQNEHLQSFVKHAYEHTKYYHELFDSMGIKPDDIRESNDLKRIPILTKDVIRERFDDFVPDNLECYKFRRDNTGGTTGSPMSYLTQEDTWGVVSAHKIWAWKHTPYRYGDGFVALGSASLFQKKSSFVRQVYDRIRNEIPLNSMNLSEDLCAKYWEKIRREGIRYIYGYASSVYLMAKFAHDRGMDVTFIQGVFTTSENLTPVYRKMIEETLMCRVMDCYGARDAGMASYEVFPGEYCVTYNSILEVVDAFDDDMGKLVSTNVLNYAFPLIRYYFGDEAKLSKGSSNYNGQVISAIYGRQSDVLRLDNGHVLTSPGFTVLMTKFDVVAYDIQKISGNEVKMQIQPVEGKWTKEQADRLQKEMERFVGEGCRFSIEYVTGFALEKNGKRRYFMNDLSNANM